MILNKGDHDILYPFGDFIYRGKLNEDEIVWIQNLAEKSREHNWIVRNPIISKFRLWYFTRNYLN